MNKDEIAKYIIENNDLMTVATANQDGKPWVSPVGFSMDEDHNLYWTSHKDAIHSQNVRQRPEVAIVVVGKNPEGNPDGVYFDATAKELNDPAELETAIKIVDGRNKESKYVIGSAENVIGDATWRIYKATPKQAWKRASAVINGQAATVREEIDL
jgi:nitroimidazol reductase NimA-like FMN-containing flavoprotein (pyridoxamine 5'-phosphate oxidase superfamily)